MYELPELEGLSITGVYPLEIEEMDHLPDFQEAVIQDQSNELALRLFCTAMEPMLEAKEDMPNSLELAHIDLKLTLVLDMMGELLRQNHPMPPATLLTMSSNSVCWASRHTYMPMQAIKLNIYPDLNFPRPLAVYGRVQASEVLQQGVWAVTLDLEGLGEASRDWLEKFIFRIHRKQVAQAKQRASDY